MSILNESSLRFPTKFWNDSCDLAGMDYALSHGCVGATTNPIIVKEVLQSNLATYEKEILEMIKSHPAKTEDDIAWMMIEKMAKDGAEKLMPIFDSKTGAGRISIQTNTKYCKSPEKLIEQALYFHTLAPNIQVKLPVTKAGVEAIEEVTYKGVSINATVCFSVPQAVAVAEAVESGLKRRAAEGLSNEDINPVCTIMIGRTDDYIKKVTKNEDRLIDPEALEWAGIACAKKFYGLAKERNYKTKLLTAAFRNIHHWTAFVGGDLLATIPTGFQKKINGSLVPVRSMIDEPVNTKYMEQLSTVDAFVKAYNEDGMTVAEFDRYGAVIDTLTQFYQGYDELVQIIRKYILR